MGKYFKIIDNSFFGNADKNLMYSSKLCNLKYIQIKTCHLIVGKE
jgi:hypothetical protein